ncbi:MAG: hypothetical protein NZ602_02760 [Thermoguttaceae bacterium]|nr:hypothetical protein [Thermoguttaceae bacterium]MDW8036772.1 hypothetical protein [Thermoguttaceae bacterium]
MIAQAATPSGWARWVWMLVLAGLVVCWAGCGGCGSSSDPRSLHFKGRWGGMSEEEWRALAEQRAKEEEEEARRAAEEAKRREEEERRKQQEEARQQAAARRKQRTSGQPASANGNSASQANSADSEAEGSQAPKPKPILPESLDQWKPEHFLLARQQFPQRFVEAVAHWAQLRRGDPELVELLLDVVWVQGGAVATSSTASSGRSQHTETVLQAVAQALASQQTPKAADGLGQLLSGQTPTEDYLTCMRVVLAALAAHPAPEHDRLLLQAVLGPENLLVRSAALHAQALQQEALRVLTNQARPELQQQLARYVDQPALAPSLRQRIEQAFVPARWDHFSANVVLLQSSRTSGPVRAAILRQFALWSAQAAQVLWLPEGLHQPAEQLAQARQVAQALWQPTMAASLQGLLSPAAMFGAGESALEQAAAQLAMTIPAGWARRLLADWLTQRWPQRPESIRNQVEQLVFEPGFLVLVARLLYEEIDPLVPVDPSAKPKPTAAKLPRPGLHAKTRHESLLPVAKQWLALWDQATERFLEQNLQQLATGSVNSSQEQTLAPLGLSLSVSVPFRPIFLWQADLAQRSQQVGWRVPDDRTIVYVSRWQTNASPQWLAERLQRSLPKARQRATEAALLVESLSSPKEGPSLRMVQIRIRPLQPQIPRSLQEQQPLVVEILAVEITSPSADPAAANSPNSPLTGGIQPQKSTL